MASDGKIIIKGFDWGPAATKVVINVGTDSDQIRNIETTLFVVKEERKNEKDTLNSERTVTDAYYSDEYGSRTENNGGFISLELGFSPEEGSPMFYDFATGFNKWFDYKLKVKFGDAKETVLNNEDFYFPEIKDVDLSEAEIKFLISKAKKIVMSQPIFLELESPITVCGDIHGQYPDLLKLFELGGFPPNTNYIFLGDYVDRGKQSIECICLLLAYKIKYDENFFILRGNHECGSINRIYGFFDECKRRYNVKLWKSFVDLFNCLPIAGSIDDKIFMVHGGLSPELKTVDQLQKIMRPTDVPEEGLLCDILWSDPDEHASGWGENDRGVSCTFNETVLKSFLEKNDLDLLCRAHQVVEDGYEFFGNRQLVTVFSAPNYCGEFDNSGAIMDVDEELMCSFKVIKGEPKS